MSPLAVIRGLEKAYAPHVTALSYRNEWELLVAIVLSAQCTDARVNMVTPKLFAELPGVQDFARAPQARIEKLIYSTGFYKNKAKNLKAAAQKLAADYGGKLPDSMEELITIPGVGRKTANVFLHVVHRKAEGVVVDTHIFRVSKRTGVSAGKTAEQVERDVMRKLDKKYWILYGDLAIQHGRVICHARKPECSRCPLNKTCPSAFKVSGASGTHK